MTLPSFISEGTTSGFTVVVDQIDIAAIDITSCQYVRVGERAEAHVRTAARRGEDDVTIRQVDRIDIVILAVGELSQPPAGMQPVQHQQPPPGTAMMPRR